MSNTNLILVIAAVLSSSVYAEGDDCESIKVQQRELSADITAAARAYAAIKAINNPNLNTVGLYSQLEEYLLEADKLSNAQRLCRYRTENQK